MLLLGAGGLLAGCVGGLATEQWALAGADRFYFTVADDRPATRAPVADLAPTAPEPMVASYSPPASTEIEPGREPVTEPAVDPWQRKLEAEDRLWEARADAAIRRERQEASVTYASEVREPASDDASPTERDDAAAVPERPEPPPPAG